MRSKINSRKRAFTLLELAVVMAVLGVVAVAASSMLGSRSVVASLQAREDAQILASALRTARNSAIANGSNVRVTAIQSGGQTLGFQTTTDSSPALKLQPDHYFADSLKVSWSTGGIVFLPAGMTDRSLSVSVSSASVTWILDVRSASGQVTVGKKE